MSVRQSFAAKVAAATVVVLVLVVGSSSAFAGAASPRGGDLAVAKECSGFVPTKNPPYCQINCIKPQADRGWLQDLHISTRVALEPLWAVPLYSTCPGRGTTMRSAHASSAGIRCTASSRVGQGSSLGSMPASWLRSPVEGPRPSCGTGSGDVRLQPSLTELHHRPAPSVAGLTDQEGLPRQAFRATTGGSRRSPRREPRRPRVRRPRRRARARGLGPVRRDRHVASVPGADRLPRAASLRLRAARAGATARRRARATGARRRPGGDPRVRRGGSGGALQHAAAPHARRAGVHRRQRPARPLPGDPRPRRAAPRRSSRTPRQPPHGPAGGRVLRVGARLQRRLSDARASRSRHELGAISSRVGP